MSDVKVLWESCTVCIECECGEELILCDGGETWDCDCGRKYALHIHSKEVEDGSPNTT